MNEEKSKRDFLEIIYQESDRLQLLIEDLLTLSNLERDGFELTCSTVDISMLLEEITPIINQQSLKHHVDYTVEADDNLTVQADKEKLKQVIINLVDNAISYTPDNGKITLKIGRASCRERVEK